MFPKLALQFQWRWSRHGVKVLPCSSHPSLVLLLSSGNLKTTWFKIFGNSVQRKLSLNKVQQLLIPLILMIKNYCIVLCIYPKTFSESRFWKNYIKDNPLKCGWPSSLWSSFPSLSFQYFCPSFSLSPALWAIPFPLWFIGKWNTRRVKPFDWTLFIVTSDHFPVRHLVT